MERVAKKQPTRDSGKITRRGIPGVMVLHSGNCVYPSKGSLCHLAQNSSPRFRSHDGIVRESFHGICTDARMKQKMSSTQSIDTLIKHGPKKGRVRKERRLTFGGIRMDPQAETATICIM